MAVLPSSASTLHDARRPDVSAYQRSPAAILLDSRRLRDDARDDPALAAAERTRFRDRHRVAHLRLVVFVVRNELRRLALALAVDGVAHLALDGHDHRLVHLVAYDRARQL